MEWGWGPGLGWGLGRLGMGLGWGLGRQGLGLGWAQVGKRGRGRAADASWAEGEARGWEVVAGRKLAGRKEVVDTLEDAPEGVLTLGRAEEG